MRNQNHVDCPWEGHTRADHSWPRAAPSETLAAAPRMESISMPGLWHLKVAYCVGARGGRIHSDAPMVQMGDGVLFRAKCEIRPHGLLGAPGRGHVNGVGVRGNIDGHSKMVF